MTDQDLEALLGDGAAALGVALPAEGVARLVAYLDLLARWSRAYNLTAVREPQRMAVVHVLDALAVAPHLHEARLLDVGTGAGLPGLVLAIALPDTRWVLLDGNGKKVRFCRQAAAELALDNVAAVQARAEDHRPPVPFPAVISRAVGSVSRLWDAAGHLVAPGGRLLLMKGEHPGAELEELAASGQVAAMGECVTVSRLRVPGLDAARHLVAVDADCLRG